MTRPARRGRREDARLLTGRGTFVANERRAGLLHAGFARSYLAHARVVEVDSSLAADVPGVVAAFDAAALGLRDIPGGGGMGPDAPDMSRPPLARDVVRYLGEAVAVVVGGSPAVVADALELVRLDLEPLPVVADIDSALRNETILHTTAATNVVARASVSNVTAPPDLGTWPVQVDVNVTSPRVAPLPVEPLSVLAEIVDGQLAVHVGHQAPHRLRRQIAAQLGMDANAVRVVAPDTGGGFGLRGMLFPEYLVVAALAQRLDRPIMWTQTRTEQFQGGTHGRAMAHRVQLAGDEDGRIRAGRLEITADVGAYPHNGSHVPMLAQFMAQGPYDIPVVAVDTTIVVTNRAPVGSYRGAGRPEATLAIERGVEAFGTATGLAPEVVRTRNLIPPGSMPYTTATGARYDSGDYPAALELVLRLVRADEVRAEQRRRWNAGEHPLGLGLAMFVERAGGASNSYEYAKVEIDDLGRLVVRVGTSSTGQGHETVWAALAAGVLSADEQDVEVVAGDTARIADGTGSFASRSVQLGGSAILRCSQQVRAQILAHASELLETDAIDLELSPGRVSVMGAPTRGVSLLEVAGAARDRGAPLEAEERYSAHAQTFPYGSTAAVVEVDPLTGRVDLQRLVSVDDCGTVLDEALVEGQVHGSLAQGIGQALFEEIVYDRHGQLVTSTLVDYPTPSAADLPVLETGRLTTPAPSNPLGAKGAGESGCLGAPPAILHATLDALRPYGVAELALPVTPQRVWAAIEAARAERRSASC